ncbi:hypothetical protein UFOVP55_23 [uncultured Caudovirales phage]|uniref:Uncharacterized protein n=1 Tax=uncultured Caudovirales phage TaxID=2100421 RepID=A0A6J5KUB7_9CAUD|nr:hypothetical protein UFOVP55_23 [uncultured Caudovirales phage]
MIDVTFIHWEDVDHHLTQMRNRIKKLETALRDCMETAEVHEIPFRDRVMNISETARRALEGEQ